MHFNITQHYHYYLQEQSGGPHIPAYKLQNLQHVLIVIPKGTVDNNLGPDRLAGPKALDPNYCRQPTF